MRIAMLTLSTNRFKKFGFSTPRFSFILPEDASIASRERLKGHPAQEGFDGVVGSILATHSVRWNKPKTRTSHAGRKTMLTPEKKPKHIQEKTPTILENPD